jgi:hypothetical protein
MLLGEDVRVRVVFQVGPPGRDGIAEAAVVVVPVAGGDEGREDDGDMIAGVDVAEARIVRVRAA